MKDKSEVFNIRKRAARKQAMTLELWILKNLTHAKYFY